MQADNKIKLLLGSFSDSDNVLVAFSGGVDSTFLLYILKEFSHIRLSAVTVKTPYIPGWEVDKAASFCRNMKIEHKIIELPLHKSVIKNPVDRCYRCKSLLFGRITEYACSNDFTVVADGSNADDMKEFRPGMKALRELRVRSPLLEYGFTKNEIRHQLKEYGLEIWDKPAYACLLTRIPYDTTVSIRELNRIEESERFLHKSGFPGARVRIDGNTARIEVDPGYFGKFLESEQRNKIIRTFKVAGFDYISLDLEGYRTDSFNRKNNLQ